MKNIKILLISITLVIFFNYTYAQLSIEPNNYFGVCPGIAINYTAVDYRDGHNMSGCEYDWTVTNGVILNGSVQQDGTSTFSGGNMITVTWNNSTQDGSIKVVSYNCSSSADNQTSPAVIYHIRSINSKTPNSITSTHKAVPFNSFSETYTTLLNYPNTGSESNKEVESYKWQIPNGWVLNGIVSTGQIYSGLTKSIQVIPDNTTGGEIKVWGHSSCGEDQGGQGYDSNPQTLAITRTFPPISVAATTSNSSIQGDKRPITLSVPSCSYYQYAWTKPAAWQWQGSNTTASVTVIPDGCTGGTVSCQITVPATGQTTTASTTYTNNRPYPNNVVPYISGSSIMCGSATQFTIINLPAFANAITWTQSGNLFPVSGQNTNSYYLNFNESGTGWVKATFNSGCGDISVPQQYSVSAGAPVRPYINNGSVTSTTSSVSYSLTLGQPTTSLQLFYVPQPGCSSVANWIIEKAPYYTSFNLVENDDFVFVTPNSVGTGSFTVKGENQCGVSSPTTVYVTVKSSGGGKIDPPSLPLDFTLSPNPANDQVTVTLQNEESSYRTTSSTSTEKIYEVQLWNAMTLIKTLKTSEPSVQLPINMLPVGTYYIRVLHDGKVSGKVFFKR